MQLPAMLSEAQVASRFGFSVAWLRAARVRGGGPRFVKIGRRVFYRLVDLEEFVNDRVVSSTSEVAKNG